MPIDLSNLSAEDIAAATAAVEAARRAHEEKERWEVEEQRKRQEEERARQEAIMRREAEQRKEAAARKAEAERRDCLAQEKAAREEAVAEEQRQSLTMGLSGLKLTIPAPASIGWTTSGSSTQSKGKRKVTEEGPSMSQYVSLSMFRSPLTFSVGRSFCPVTCAQSPRVFVRRSCGRTERGGRRAIDAGS
jgi:membrane protein involved in colicin uptake